MPVSSLHLLLSGKHPALSRVKEPKPGKILVLRSHLSAEGGARDHTQANEKPPQAFLPKLLEVHNFPYMDCRSVEVRAVVKHL